jgi:hypothetical protein
VRNFLFTLGLVAVVAGLAGLGFYRLGHNAALEAEARQGDTLAWLQTEFHLTDDQFAAVGRLHRAYTETCARHCMAIMEARSRHSPPAEIRALEAMCVASMTEHFQRVAAMMPPGQGSRYLALILPRIAAYDHRGAPTLRGTP